MTVTSPAVRLTQKERREATIAKLLDATIECLIEHGYRDTSIARICKRAGVSHGGLFRHFASRTALLVAATHEMSRRHFHQLMSLLAAPPKSVDMAEELVTFARDATREPLAAAWREVMVATRSDEELRVAVKPAVQEFEDSVFEVAAGIPGAPSDTRAFGTLLLSILHLYDSEASHIGILFTEDVELLRFDWAVNLLREQLQAN